MVAQQSVTRQHADWLALMEVSGPFLSLPVLLDAFPHGLDLKENEPEMRRRLRLAYEEWADNQGGSQPDPAIHQQWLRFILDEILDMQPIAIQEGQQIPASLSYTNKEYRETLHPTLVIKSPHEPQPRLLIQLYPQGQNLHKPIAGKAWNASPETRMMELLRNTNVQLGLLTNGEHWMLVDAPANETTGYYSWYASLWLEEPLTLRAFHSLLGMQRFFNVEPAKTIESLLRESASKQHEVTIQLGDQVRRAVEVLVQTLDRIDKDSGRTLLQAVPETELYAAALSVMMRLVFLLSAEERKLLLLEDPLYDKNYAVSTLYQQLRELADQQGEEVLGLHYDAWSRLLALFRIVHGGLDHQDLQLPAYGGHLFDPDRYPFLEGRPRGTRWRETPAHPLHIDNRTVLYLLNALQYLQVRVGGVVEPRRLSFRGLDIEQIGHVYEGLLDHTVKRAQATILGLQGSDKSEPEVPLEELEAQASKDEATLLAYLKEATGRSEAALTKGLASQLEKQDERSRLMEACDNKQEIFQRVLPYAGLLRKDVFKNFIIVTPGSVYMTHGQDRRATGTHYTPRSLTEPIVKHALDPLVYIGPAEGLPEEQWQLRSAAEILDLTVCDFAMGSGAFLVQTCRYLAEKLVATWEKIDQQQNAHNVPPIPQRTPSGQLSHGEASDELIPLDREERLVIARRLVSERCIYGVDINPMAVEMAKLSMWLITMAKGQPFTFLDHSLRSGDSLLGASDSQLENWSMDAKSGEITQMDWIRVAVKQALPKATQLRKKIRLLHEHDISGIEQKEHMLKEADQAMEIIKLGADLLIGITLSDSKRQKVVQDTLGNSYMVLIQAFSEGMFNSQYKEAQEANQQEFKRLRKEVDELLKGRRPFHWQLEFPEVFLDKKEKAGFAAIVSNPPFQGGGKITGSLGTDYRDYLVKYLSNGKRGIIDLCTYFFLRATSLAKQEATSALIATNTIAQGDTREAGLDRITASGWTIPRAISSRKWPGEASLEVAEVWLKKGHWQGAYVLNNANVDGITSFLTTNSTVQGKPYSLQSNANTSFIGSYVLGTGFILDTAEAQSLIAKKPRNKNVIFPYLNGEDLNSRPDQSPSRWVINFHDWSLETAEKYSDCINIVREKVKPEREKQNDQGGKKFWWRHLRTRPALYSTIANMRRTLVIPRVSKYMLCVWQPTNIVISDALVIITLPKDADFALIQCTYHEAWVRLNGSSMRNDQRYTPSDCFETFPFPPNMDSLNNIGERYYNHRQSIMQARQEGLTKTYNRFHDSNEQAQDIVTLRELHKEMDEAVAHAYGWNDLKLEHGFHETKQGLRYTISEAARMEVLDRLLLLNHQRHAEEVKAGLVDENGKPTKKGKALLQAKKANAQRASTRNATSRKNEETSTAQQHGSVGSSVDNEVGQAVLFDL
jgi:hypothetical protein